MTRFGANGVADEKAFDAAVPETTAWPKDDADIHQRTICSRSTKLPGYILKAALAGDLSF